MFLARLVLSISLLLSIAAPSAAHDHWISRGGYKGNDNVGCCGPSDCGVISGKYITATKNGYWVHGPMVIEGGSAAGNLVVELNETVPYGEATPSETNEYYSCRKPGMDFSKPDARRCFFAPSSSF